MKRTTMIVAGFVLIAGIAGLSLYAGDGDKIFTCPICPDAQASAISVTGTLISAENYLSTNADCSGASCEAKASTSSSEGGNVSEGASCPYSKTTKASATAVNAKSEECEKCPHAGEACAKCLEAKAAATKTDGCCAEGKAEAKTSSAHGILDKDGNFYFAIAEGNVCDNTLESHYNKTVKLTGTKSEFNGRAAIVASNLEEIQLSSLE